MKTRIILPALYLFLALSCENKNKKFDKEIDNFMDQEFAEPDLSFEIAIDAFNEKNFKSSAEDIGNATFFLSTLNFEDDTTHQKILEIYIKQLEGLQEDVSNGKIIDVDVLKKVFFETDQSIAAYHLAIVEADFRDGNEKKQGLERLHRALIRLDNSILYHPYEFTEQELINLAAIRKKITDADKSTPQLWKKVNDFFTKIGEKTQSKYTEN